MLVIKVLGPWLIPRSCSLIVFGDLKVSVGCSGRVGSSSHSVVANSASFHFVDRGGA